MENNCIILEYSGEFSLAKSIALAAKASFIEGFVIDSSIVDLAILIESSWKSLGIRLFQENDKVTVQVFDNPDKASSIEIKNHLERILSLNIDATNFVTIVAKDIVVENLYNSNKGIRPILFSSCYEAAARAIIGHQLPVKQASRITSNICKEYGKEIKFDTFNKYAFPAPNVLETLPLINGLAERKVQQLRILGSKVGDWLSSESLLKMGKEKATVELQRLPGIGPFSSDLILLRGAGDTDAFPVTEMRFQRAMALAYNLGDNPDLQTLLNIAENWRPFRTWVGLYLRNSI